MTGRWRQDHSQPLTFSVYADQCSASVKTAQGKAMPRKACSPKGVNGGQVSATAPEIRTLWPRACTRPQAG